MNASNLFSYRVIQSNSLVEAIEYELSLYSKTNRLSDMRARKIDVHNEYMENIETTVLKKYNKLSDVPKASRHLCCSICL